MTDPLDTLRYSVEQLRALIEPLTPEQLRTSAYPTEWTVADVLSHLGSGAVIFVQSVDSAVTGVATSPEFNKSVWGEWDAKSPDAQRADLPGVDAAVVARLGALNGEERSRLKVSLGPFDADYTGFVGLRVSEHVLHTWDVAVTFNPDAVLAPQVVEGGLAGVELISRFAAKPTGSTRTYVIRTVDPVRTYGLVLTPESASLSPGDADVAPDVTLPAEAFVRLVYGRLDADHTPGGVEGAEHLDELRRVFPGF